jgi:hypothetical protein
MFILGIKKQKKILNRHENIHFNNFSYDSSKILILLIKIISLTNKIFLILDQFIKIRSLKFFRSEKNINTLFCYKIRHDFKNIVSFFAKNNCVLYSVNQFFDFYRYSILNTEIKVEKFKKFIYFFLKTKKKEKEPNQKAFFFKKFGMEELRTKNINSTFERSIKKKKLLKIFFNLKKKCEKISLIRKKLTNLNEKFFKIYDVFKKKSASSQNKKFNSNKRKEILWVGKYLTKFKIPIKIKKNTLFFQPYVTKNLNLKILFQSRIFKKYFQKIFGNNINFTKEKFLKKLNPTNIFLPDKTRPYEKILRGEIKKKNNCFSYFFKKINIKIGKFFIYYRLLDLFKESSLLWENKRKVNMLNIKKIFKEKNFTCKKKISKSFLLYDNILKNYILALQRRVKILCLKINSESKRKKSLYQRLQEFNSMELDFQMFTNLIYNLNKFKKRTISN